MARAIITVVSSEVTAKVRRTDRLGTWPPALSLLTAELPLPLLVSPRSWPRSVKESDTPTHKEESFHMPGSKLHCTNHIICYTWRDETKISYQVAGNMTVLYNTALYSGEIGSCWSYLEVWVRNASLLTVTLFPIYRARTVHKHQNCFDRTH